MAASTDACHGTRVAVVVIDLAAAMPACEYLRADAVEGPEVEQAIMARVQTPLERAGRR
jgi:hypothetical protein